MSQTCSSSLEGQPSNEEDGQDHVGEEGCEVHYLARGLENNFFFVNRGQSYKANFDINYIKNGLNKLNFTLNYINFDVIFAKKVL